MHFIPNAFPLHGPVGDAQLEAPSPPGGRFMYRPYGSALASSNSFPDVESTIRGLSQDLCTAFNTGNYDQWAVLFASDAQLMPPNHEPVQGLKAIERVMRELGEAGHHDLRFETAQITLAGDMA